MKRNPKILAVIAVTTLLTASLTFLGTTAFYAFVEDKAYHPFEGSEKIGEVLDLLEKDYYYGFDRSDLVDRILDNMVNSLGDPYTTYFDPQAYSEFLELVNGTYAGVGASVLWDKDMKAVIISKAFDDSPAANADLKNGDRVIKIDGGDLSGDDLESAVAKMKGEPGTSVVLTVLKAGQTEPVDITIVRDTIQIPSVESEVRGDIGYITIAMFDPATAGEFKTHLDSVLASGAKGIVLDLRDNGGGLVDSVTKVANLLLPKGQMIYYIQDKQGKKQEFKSVGDGLDFPVVVLVNENSASATELLAGSLRDNKSAPLVGKNTYGKGVMQAPHELSDGSMIKMTVAKYFIPSGYDINEVGLAPDYETEYETEADEQYQKAAEVLKSLMK